MSSLAAASTAGDSIVAGFFLTMSAICVIAVYWLPVIVAWRRKLANRSQILVITLLTGWTFVGWVIAFVMALKPLEQPRYYAPPPAPWQ